MREVLIFRTCLIWGIKYSFLWLVHATRENLKEEQVSVWVSHCVNILRKEGSMQAR